jgi:N-formylmaleamate deformylase
MYPNWTAHDIVVDGIKIHYTRTGDGTKAPIVLAHGFSDNGMCWLPTAQALEADYDVILPDARGHGLSARVQPGEEFSRAEDLARLIRGLGLNKPVVGGHSMGASTTAQLDVDFPGVARALILEDPAWFERPAEPPQEEPEPRPNPFMDFLAKAPELPIETLMERCRADSPTWGEIELRPWAESKQQFDLNVVRTVDHLLMEPGYPAAKISCPTLLLTAEVEKGAIVSAEVARHALEVNPNIQWVHIPNAGHNIRRENFPAFIQAVKDFLKKLNY